MDTVLLRRGIPGVVEFDNAGRRFKDSKRLLQRFIDAIAGVLSKGRRAFRAVDEAHNELCIASVLLFNCDLHFASIDYEPLLAGCAKSIDFRATADDGLIVFVDFKTILPQPKDRWDQYQRALKEGWFPNAKIHLFKEWLGGELFHNMFATRILRCHGGSRKSGSH